MNEVAEPAVTQAAIKAAWLNPCGWVYVVEAILPPEGRPPVGNVIGDSIAASMCCPGYSDEEMAGDFRRENNRFAAAADEARRNSVTQVDASTSMAGLACRERLVRLAAACGGDNGSCGACASQYTMACSSTRAG